MKKKALSLALALAMCLVLAVPAFAAEAKAGDTTITDANGITYQLSNPIIRVEPAADKYSGEVVYIVPDGTTVVPLCPDGYVSNGLSYVDKNENSIDFGNSTVMGLGIPGVEGITVNIVDLTEYKEYGLGAKASDYYLGIMSRRFPGDNGDWDWVTLLFLAEASVPAQPEQPTTPTQPEQPAKSEIAMPTNDKLTVNGVPADPTVYKIDGANYFKIRDVAALLNGTEKQFSVGYDGALKSVTATTGQGYEKLDTDLVGAPAGGNKTADPSNDTIYVNGEKIDAQVYKIDGGNYFKLRDLGKALNFSVDWSKEQGMMIDTSKPYTE